MLITATFKDWATSCLKILSETEERISKP